MTDPALRPGHVAAAALTLAGFLLVMAPGRAPDVLRLVIVTVAAAACLHAFLVHGGPSLRSSPFRWSMRESGREATAFEAQRLRTALGGRRHRVRGGHPLPPATIRLLRPLVEAHLVHEGAGDDEPERRELALARLSPLSRAILAHDATVTPPWFLTLRSDPADTARIVGTVLDDIGLAAESESHSSAPHE